MIRQPFNFTYMLKSFIVATKKIRIIEGNRLAIQEHLIPIGQTYKNSLMKRVNKL